MRTENERKDRAELHYNLVKILTDNIENDNQYFKRLLWALEIISNALSKFENEEEC